MDLQPLLQHRKLIKHSIFNDTATDHICSSYCNSSDISSFCKPPCLTSCPSYCHNIFQSLIPSPSHVVFKYHIHHKSRKFLIIIGSILATTFIALLCYVIFVKFYAGSRRSSSQPRIINETHDNFLHEGHRPVVDHHIWYINTVGLEPSIICAITVLKYKKGDGLVEGTDCRVCLNEFQEDETLRLLPKCNHAFHISCIDTWLRSHTNCPLCRAPIVKINHAATTSSSLSSLESNDRESTQVDILVECERELEDEVVERSDQDSEEIQPIRRSVSLDSVSASKMIHGLSNSDPQVCTGNSDTHLAKERDLSLKIVPKIVGRGESLLRFVDVRSSSIGRSMINAPVLLKRSFSCSGKFFLSRSG